MSSHHRTVVELPASEQRPSSVSPVRANRHSRSAPTAITPVSNLRATVERQAPRYDLLLISDSNASVTPSYVRDMESTMRATGAGLVPSVVCAEGAQTLGAALDNAAMNSDVAPGIALLNVTRMHAAVRRDRVGTVADDPSRRRLSRAHARPRRAARRAAHRAASRGRGGDDRQHSIACENGGDRVERRGGTIAGRQPRAEDGGEATGDRVANSGRLGDGPRLNVLVSWGASGRSVPNQRRHARRGSARRVISSTSGSIEQLRLPLAARRPRHW